MKKLFIILMLMANQIHSNTENQTSQVAYLSGGCYWGLEELIRLIPGVLHTKVGFSGGQKKNVSKVAKSTHESCRYLISKLLINSLEK